MLTRVGFSKANELFFGRASLLAAAGLLVAEYTSGAGPLAALGLRTEVPLQEADVVVLVFVGFTLFAAVNPGR